MADLQKPSTRQKTPLLLLSGFLGSGKTSLINQLVKLPDFASSAIIVNEFGETSLDHHLIQTEGDHVIELANGCICCSLNSHLADAVNEVLLHDPAQIIIETTGLADPLPVMRSIIEDPAIFERIKFSGLVTVFDAENGFAMLEQYEEAQRQIALADLIVLSRLDRLEQANETADEIVLKTGQKLSRLNDSVPIVDSRAFLKAPEKFLDLEFSLLSHSAAKTKEPHVHKHDHAKKIKTLLIEYEPALEPGAIELFFELLLSAHAASVPRLKGLINIQGEELPLVVHAVGRQMEPPEPLTKGWPDDQRLTRMIIFCDGIEPDFVKSLFDSCINKIAPDQADRQALSQNPLAIPGQAPKAGFNQL